MQEDRRTERGLALGAVLILLLVVLAVAPFYFGFRPGREITPQASIFTGIYLQTWGVMFLLSYFFPHKSFFFRALLWVCENFSSPRGRRMAFFYSLLAFSLGTVALFQGLGLK